ncbi:MAG: hypothetical protein ACKVS8_13495 [Phycisphaerales bacterium]
MPQRLLHCSFLTHRFGRAATMGLLLAAGTVNAQAADNRVVLQLFEASWVNVEARMPDIFMAGYGAMWVPHPVLSSTGSVGYDPFDRFNLGTPDSPTAFGTEATFRQYVKEAHMADVLVYPDSVLNHNGARTSDANFIADGGWPGVYLPGNGPTNNPPGLPYMTSGLPPWTICGNFSTRAPLNFFWGEFHGSGMQSENPGGANYCLWLGDLVSLVDFAQETFYPLIRQPVAANPQNIPPGRVRNRPDPANARFYPDTALTPITFTNPGIAGFSNATNWTLYPYNTAAPASGDAVPETLAGYLGRWSQWMLADVGVDGFRLDAAKHSKHDFWNEWFDGAVNQQRTRQDGSKASPFSFVEAVDGNSSIQFYTRKASVPASGGNAAFSANRDALDINEAGPLRNALNGQFIAANQPTYPAGGATGQFHWNTIIDSSFDRNDDGDNNGSQGVHHVFSHDNGSTGNGSSPPGLPSAANAGLAGNAYVLWRPTPTAGGSIVYHNAREMHDRFQQTAANRFWVREGNPTALGNATSVGFPVGGTSQVVTNLAMPTAITDMVRIHNAYTRGSWSVVNSTDSVNPDINTVMVFTRGNATQANVVCGVNNWYGNGTQLRSVVVNFPVGTRLRELTGHNADTGASGVNSDGSIPLVHTVDGSSRILIGVPNNRNSNGTQHNKGYIAYGPAAPSGTLTLTNVSSTIAADITTGGSAVPTYRARITPVDVIGAETFEVQLATTKTDATAGEDWDNYANFRFNKGYVDYNHNGGVDLPGSNAIDGGYENFLTQSSPIDGAGGTGTTGLYRQVIQTADLPEGMNYLSVLAYRERIAGTLPILREFRKVIYVDRFAPQVMFTQPPGNEIATTNFQFTVTAADRTTNKVHIIPNVAQGVDPLTLVSGANQATQRDRFTFTRTIGNLPTGTNTVTIVAFELSGRSSVTTSAAFTNILANGDANIDTFLSLDDQYASWALGTSYLAQADMNKDGNITATDRRLLEQSLRTGELNGMRGTQR